MPIQRPSPEDVKDFRPLDELIPEHWTSGDVNTFDGTRIHYTRTGGDKPALILLHGVQVDGLSWLRTAQAFEADYDVVMPDARGHGQSNGLENGLSSSLQIMDLVSVIYALRLDRPFVVGHSMGADIAARLAAAHPLRAVVLVDPALQNLAAMMPPVGDEKPPWMQSLFDTMTALKTQTHAERMVTGLNLLPPGTELWHEADYVSFVYGQAQFDLSVFQHMRELGYVFEEPNLIARIACPILLLTARQMMSPDSAPDISAFSDHWQQGQHIHFPDSGHAIYCDQFERFVTTVREFLAAQG